MVQRFNGIEEHGLIDGITCIMWEKIPEMLDKVTYYIEHEEEREAIGRNGKELMIQRHSWKRRIDGLFAMIGGLTHG